MCSQCISSIKFINIHTVLFYIGDWYLYIFKIDMVILFVVSFPLSNSSLAHQIDWVSVSKKFWWHVLDTWYHPHPMIRVFTQSPDMIADMIWIHLITLSYQCLQNLFTQGHDMVDEVLFKKKRRFSLTKTIFAINYSPLLLFAHHSTARHLQENWRWDENIWSWIFKSAVMVEVSPDISRAYFTGGRGWVLNPWNTSGQKTRVIPQKSMGDDPRIPCKIINFASSQT